MKLLIIEGEEDLRRSMLQYLKRERYLCEQVSNFRDAYKKIVNHEYDCVIIDPGMPGEEGARLISLLRAESPETGIIIVSGRDAVEDKIHGLELGADDYLSKPFQLPELSARLKALLRRKVTGFKKEIHFDDLIINQEERRVTAKGVSLNLTRKEFDILVYLARNKNRVVSKESIAEHLWGDNTDDSVSFDFIYAHVKNLRKKLADNQCGHYLKTVYGIGYKFEAG